MKKICAKMCTQKMCRKCAHKNVQKLCTQKMRKNVHTQKCAKMCTRRICKNVHTQNLRKSVCRSFCRFVRRVVSENCVDEKFPVMHNKKFYVREHCPTCVQKVFAMCARRFAQIVHVRKCAQGTIWQNVQK